MRGGRLRARHRHRSFTWGRLCDAVRALNWLYCPGLPECLWPSSPSSPQARVLHQLYQPVLQACRRGVYPDPREAQEDPPLPLPSFYAMPSSSYVPLQADKVSLPPPGAGASADMLELLPPRLADLFASPDALVNMPSAAELRAVPAFMGVADGQYAPFCRRLADSNMCLFRDSPPLVINGVFAVPKGPDAQRFIVDMRPGNSCFQPPESVLLANPGVISELHLPPGASLYVATADADNMYHRLRPPTWLQDYMGLPPVNSDSVGLPGPSRTVYPVLTSCPMGFNWAVLLAQSIHERVLDELPEHGPERRIAPGGPPVIGPAGHLAYIDDYSAIGTDREAVNQNHSAAEFALGAAGLPPKASKSIPALPAETADAPPAQSLGMEFWHNGTVRPLTSNTRALVAHTHAMLRRGFATGKQMEQLLGSWTWNSLLRRPVLSVFCAVYAFARRHREHRRPRPLPFRVQCELRAALGLLPLLHADLSAPFADRVYATDASNWGAGVCYSKIARRWGPEAAIRSGSAAVGETGAVISAVPELEWRTAVSSPWGTDRHINRLEGQAAIMGLRHAARSPQLWGTRITFLLDSSVMIGALRKGRSSSWQLNQVCRRAAALQFATGLRPLWTWCPTALNPADRPSRRRRHVS